MASFKLMLALVIAALQLCTANPASVGGTEGAADVTKLYTETELQRAAENGMTNRDLIHGNLVGLTFEEMVKLNALKQNDRRNKGDVTPAMVNEVCEILVPEHKAAAEYTSEQESLLKAIMESLQQLPKSEQLGFARNSLCVFASQPSKYGLDSTSSVNAAA